MKKVNRKLLIGSVVFGISFTLIGDLASESFSKALFYTAVASSLFFLLAKLFFKWNLSGN